MKRLFLAGVLLTLATSAHADPLDPFKPSGYAVAPLSVDTSGETTTIPRGTQSLLVQNTGSDTVYCQPGTAATTSAIVLQNGQSFIFPMNGGRDIACIAGTSTATVNLIPGNGYSLIVSGGGGSSGSVPNPIGVTQSTSPWVVSGTVTANAGTNLNTSALATSAKQDTGNTSLATIATNTGSSVPAGTAVIGKVGIDQTTPGTTNKVSIDQTTPGTTNAVVATIAAGSSVVGYVSNDPCATQLKTSVAIATSSGNTQLVAGVSAKKVYICSEFIVGQTAWVGNIIEGTGSACTTANEAAIQGSTTAASGLSFLSNNGFTFGNGLGTIGVTATSANGVCLLQSGTAALAGNITYVQQ